MAEEGGHEKTQATIGPCTCQHVSLGTGSYQLQNQGGWVGVGVHVHVHVRVYPP